jgi:predicted nucleic acid-binding protein
VFLVDTNVLLDLATDDPRWADWSQRTLETAALAGPLFINPIIYAESSIGFSRIEALDAVLKTIGIAPVEIPRTALFLAGKAFATYRRRGGAKTRVLPGLLIGAHAAVLDLRLITRDLGRYRTYYPTIALVTPTDT